MATSAPKIGCDALGMAWTQWMRAPRHLVDPINLNAFLDLPGYPTKQLIVGRGCAGPPEHNRFHLVQLAHGHSRRVVEVVSAFEQSLNAVLWHGLVEGRSDVLDEGYCCPDAGRFVFRSCDKPLITSWRSFHQIPNLRHNGCERHDTFNLAENALMTFGTTL